MAIHKESKVIVVMGVSGSGKSTIAHLLSQELNIKFIEGDDHHPPANINKMANGQPLNDEDRLPWLDSLNKIALTYKSSGCVITCSALRHSYREKLAQSLEDKIIWIYLKGDYDLIYDRMTNRKGHFMNPEMLKSQFDTLEEPNRAITIKINDSPELMLHRIKQELNMTTEIGVIGMGVMGKSLSRNLARNGFIISVYNRHVAGKEENIAADFKSEHPELEKTLAFDNLSDFVQSLAQPRKIILMVNAGPTIDAIIDDLCPHLDEEDIIIDAGNSHFADTDRRINFLQEKKLHFIGTGVSGGEKGALLGPSNMPSGDRQAYEKVKIYLETIAAKDSNAKPCCTYIGEKGSGHFVKMIHNGIEYAEMQLLAECYAILKAQNTSNKDAADIFETWMKDQGSYLLSITIDILRKKEGNDYILDLILDKAANKGTGKWATSTIADSGEPATMIPSALFARYLSFFKEKRQKAELLFSATSQNNPIPILELMEAYQFARIINHHQGFALINSISDKHSWNVNLAEVARIWTEGCIIKSDLMKNIVETLQHHNNLLFNKPWSSILSECHKSIQAVVIKCIENQEHIPCLTEALNYFHGIKIGDGSANLIQAQRDYFGAHTYKKKNDPSEQSYHTLWET